MKDLVQRILAEEHVLEVRMPRFKPSDIPEIDMSLFQEEMLDSVREDYGKLRWYLCEGCIILYDLVDQDKRHEFESYLISKYGSEAERLIGKSVLSVAKQQSTRSYLHYLLSDLRRPNNRANEIEREIAAEWDKGYQHTSNEVKVRFTETMQDKLYEVLRVLSVQSPTHSSFTLKRANKN
jgi:hypothetical protein